MDREKCEEGWAALAFDTESDHNLSSLPNLERVLRMNVIDARSALEFGQRMLTHVHPKAYEYLEEIKIKLGKSDRHGFCQMGQYAFRNLRAHFHLEKVGEEQRRNFYAPNGPLLVRKPGSKKLLVLFTTMFNSFFFSNLAMTAMLSRLDCNILFLRDSTLAMHLLGVQGYAYGFEDIAPAIEQTARQEECDEIYIAGYSSGGFAALWTSLLIDCRGYLGISTNTNCQLQREPKTKMAQEHRNRFRSYVDPHLLCDLRPFLRDADPSVPRYLYYGAGEQDDVVQAEYVADLDTIEVIKVPNIGHIVPLKLMADRALLPAFKKLLEG